MKKRILLTGAALAQSLVLAALTVNPGVAVATPYGPNIVLDVNTICDQFADTGTNSFSISNNVSYDPNGSAWCKKITLESIQPGTILTLTENITWDDHKYLWTDWHEEIVESEGWLFNGESPSETLGIVFSSPLEFGDMYGFQQELICSQQRTENCGGPIYIVEYPTVRQPTVPEPGTLLLLGAGLIGLAGRRYATRR